MFFHKVPGQDLGQQRRLATSECVVSRVLVCHFYFELPFNSAPCRTATLYEMSWRLGVQWRLVGVIVSRGSGCRKWPDSGRSRDFQGPLTDLGTIVTIHGGGWMLLRLEGAVERWADSRE